MQNFPSHTRIEVQQISEASSEARIVIQAIAMATEALRDRLRKLSPWNTSYGSGLGIGPLLGQPSPQLVDYIAWPFLLLHNNCLEQASKLAGTTCDAVLEIAYSICPREHLAAALLINCQKDGIKESFKVLSPYLQKWSVQDRRMREGARRGGTKSGQRRTDQRTTLSSERLRRESDQLLAQGKLAREIAGILSARHGLHANTIRRKIRN